MVFENKRTSFGEAENTVAKELNRIKNYLMKKVRRNYHKLTFRKRR